jgi:hypothetical protein
VTITTVLQIARRFTFSSLLFRRHAPSAASERPPPLGEPEGRCSSLSVAPSRSVLWRRQIDAEVYGEYKTDEWLKTLRRCKEKA